MAKTPVDKLLKNHPKLTHSTDIKVVSHVQREQGEWVINTLMLADIDVSFKYKRKKLYRSLKGQRVNVTYYPENETIAGMEIEIMKVVRIRTS
ncbi:hypothetical protein [Psychrobium sp. 1_MG-2023]|uniref:hypothetical protein n=1 Tax=Psychrobium sp. 1_MG-2023 TaxID=3062624 RepID=UPI000C342A4F|nr:hypothetical protein [Psychrobium sp. 1_MG-2023]MDP2562406.1 hypothetical protein [Psychrobium sp. 1_MG-2023]PKF56135.1 hypothetical protein CW748_10785 [Alteromonadales bacterium alter-6D02]